MFKVLYLFFFSGEKIIFTGIDLLKYNAYLITLCEKKNPLKNQLHKKYKNECTKCYKITQNGLSWR